MSMLNYIRSTRPVYDYMSDQELTERWKKKFHPNQEMEELDELYREKSEQLRQDEFSKIGVLGRGMRIGYEQAKDLIFDGGIRGLANYALGREEQAAEDFKRYSEAQKETQEKYPQVINWKDVSDFDDTVDFALQSAGQFLPDLIGGLGSGLVVKQGTKLAAKKIAKDMSKESLDKLGKYSMLTGASGYAAVQNFGETYNQVYADSNGDPDMMKVLLHGTVNSALDTILPAQIIGKMSKEAREAVADYALKRLLKGFGKGALVEGATEGAQTLSNELAMTDGWNYFKNFDQVDFDAVEEAIATGFFGGGPIRGGIDLVTGVNPEQLANQKTKAEDVLTSTALKQVEKGGGLTEPLIPTKPEVTKPTVRKPKDKNRHDKRIFELQTGEKYEDYQERKHLESLEKSATKRAANNAKLKEYQKEKAKVEKQLEFRETDAFKGGLEFVETKLKALEDSGKQGKSFASALRDVMKTPEFSVGDALLAFNSAKIANEIMPQGSGYEVKFARSLSFEGGTAQGLVDKSAKVLSLAFDAGKTLEKSVPTIHADTASHEAFHVLQDFWKQHEPRTAKLLDSAFGSRGQSVDYENSSIRKWMKRLDPAMDDILVKHSRKPKPQKEGEAQDTSPQGILGSELQAYAFQTYSRARRAGKTPVLTGGLARYFDFIYKYLRRLGNSLRGMGFQTVQDVFETASSGIYAQKFENLGVTNDINTDPNRTPTEASTLGSSGRFFYDRAMTKPFRATPEVRQETEYFMPVGVNDSPVIAKAQFNPNQKKFPIGVKSGFHVWDAALGKFNGMGYKHIKLGHGRELTEVTKDDDIYNIIQRVVTEGKAKKIGQTPDGFERYTFRLKDPNWSHYVQVAVNKPQTAEGNNYASVTTAFPENWYNKKTATKSSKDELATEEDIKQYRSVRASSLDPNAVSTRFPTTKQATEDPIAEHLVIGMEEILNDPKMVDGLSDIIRSSFKDGKDSGYNLLTAKEKKLSNKDMLEAFVEAAKRNLLFIFDSLDPSIRERSKLWYDGANKIAGELATKYDITLAQAAGVLAVFSPQMDWYRNVNLAERFLDVTIPRSGSRLNQEKSDTDLTDEMVGVINRIGSFLGKSKKFPEGRWKDEVNYLIEKRPSLYTLQNTPEHDLGSMSSVKLQAMWVRAYDEAYNSKEYENISPEGNKVGIATTTKGKPIVNSMGGNGLDPIMKALNIVAAKEEDIASVISQNLGFAHKVRNFYNNIVAPNAKEGYVTVDTHAIAAAMFKPLGGSDIEVSHGLGVLDGRYSGKNAVRLGKGIPVNANTGAKGTYGLLLEAHRRAANERGMIPREMQSITWEAIRGLFTSTAKNDKTKASANAIWDQYSEGKISQQEVLERIRDESGGFRDPVWRQSTSEGTLQEGDTNNQGELDRLQLGREAQSVDSRTRGPIARGPSGEVEASSLEGSDLIGINVRSDTQSGLSYSDLIVDGRKTLETRNTDSLRPYVGKRVGIIKTGEGTARAIGSVTIGEPQVVGVDKFRQLENEHLVPEGSQFDITDQKYLYPLINPKRFDVPYKVAKFGIKARPVSDDPFVEASSINIVPDDMMRKAVAKDGVQFKRINNKHDPNNPNSKPFIGSSGLTDNSKLFANRELEDGTKVLVRPNLNGWIQEGGPPTVTQTVHKPGATKAEDLTENSYKQGVYGYDKIASVKGSIELDVAQKARADIAKGVKPKLPMAGGYGNLNQISEQEMLDIMQNADHILKFNPKTHHLFYNQEDGYAVKGYNGVGVHYNTSVFVKGELDYWSEKEAPTALGGVETKNTYKDSIEASALDDLWDATLADRKNENFINRIISALPKLRPSTFGSLFIEDVVDSNASIRELEESVVEAETGVKGLRDAENSAYKFIEMMGNTSGRREIVLKHGAPKIDENGEITLRDDTKGIVEIFMQLESKIEKDNFTKYALARRAKALGEKERLITPEQIEDGLSLENEKFKQMFDDYQKFNQGMLDFLVQTGVITPTERVNLGKYDYIPFYRELDEQQFDKRSGMLFAKDRLGPRETTDVLNNPTKPLVKYRGGQSPIGDLVGNTIRNASAFLDAGMKNLAMQKTVDLMKEAGVGFEIKQNQATADVLFAKYRVNGRHKYYNITRDHARIFKAISSFTPRQSVGLFKHMETIGRWFREFITHQPAFIVANYLRGEMSGLVTVDAKVNPLVDSLKGFKNSLTDAESIQEMKLLGGMGGYNFGDDFRDSAGKLNRQLRVKNRDYTLVNTPQAISDMVATMWGGVTKVGEASELAYRDGIFRTLRKQGKSRSEAAYEALNMINFNRKGAMRTPLGAVLGSLIPLVPFLNARIQGLYRTFDPMVTGRQADRKKTIFYGSLLTLGAMALYAESSEDERYEREPLHLRLNYHIFYVGDKRYLIPRAFEVGAVFTTLPEFIMGAIKKGDSEELYKATMMTLLNTFSFNPTPQAVKPLIEIATNYDMFRGTYIDSPFEMSYKPSARYTPGTSEISKDVAEATENPFFSLSPNQITKLITGYLGSMGTTILTATDVVLSKGDATPSRPTGVFGENILGTVAEATGFGRFVKDDLYTGNQFITNFYETKKEVDQIYNTIQRYRKDGQLEVANTMMKENRGMISQRKRLNAINQRLREINQRIRKVRTSPDLTPEKKRSQLLVLIERRNRIGRNFDKLYQRMRKQDK